MVKIAKNNPFLKPQFVISLDFELYWGVRDVRPLAAYTENLSGVWQVLPEILQLFKKYNIEATWATVGLLSFSNFSEITAPTARQLNLYENKNLNPYIYIQSQVNSISVAPLQLHFAPDLVQLIMETPGQELGSHTFSHFYALETGQDLHDFEVDLAAMNKVAAILKSQFTSIVFPRNQVNSNYLPLLQKGGYIAYRGTPQNLIYRADSYQNFDAFWKKALRFLDIFFPLCNIKTALTVDKLGLVNVPATRFFQPFAQRPFGLEQLKINRIKNEMTKAARKNGIYHLWWHPHNFGSYQKANLTQLEEVLIHFSLLKQQFEMESKNMSHLASAFLANQ